MSGKCRSGHKIENVDKCKMAANQLGLSYGWSLNMKNRPSGCFKKDEKVYYNEDKVGELSESRQVICSSGKSFNKHIQN